MKQGSRAVSGLLYFQHYRPVALAQGTGILTTLFDKTLSNHHPPFLGLGPPPPTHALTMTVSLMFGSMRNLLRGPEAGLAVVCQLTSSNDSPGQSYL
jgi:hypothetical protein